MRMSKTPINPAKSAWLYFKARAAARYADEKNTVGMDFDAYGRNLWWRLLRCGGLHVAREAAWLLINPVSITRYFEFPFVFQCLPDQPGAWLDVSSPRLFGLFVADKNLVKSLKMINPDTRDISQTAAITKQLELENLRCSNDALDELAGKGQLFDCIWSISVIEHIAGEYDDSAAMQMMYALLKPGGRLIITVPTDRTFYEEYRKDDIYGLNRTRSSEDHFFQRVYDQDAIGTRLLEPIRQRPVVMRWFGEKIQGQYRNYEKRWIAEGLSCTVDDPREISDNYQEFTSWQQMPGHGVCGFMVLKALDES
jgi:predicted SAM-dependent methyltransferase